MQRTGELVRKPSIRPLCFLLLVCTAACNEDAGPSEADTGEISGTDGATDTDAATGTTDASASDSTGGGDRGGSCLLPIDENCPSGTKCMPKALPGEFVADQTACCDLVGNPKAIDDPCQQLEYYGSCLDDCGNGVICVVDDYQGLAGICRPMCDARNPECGSDEICKPFFESVDGAIPVPICMPQCDPLAQDCAQPGWLCFQEVYDFGGGGGFLCGPPPAMPPLQLGDPCEGANSCEAGLVCLQAQYVPGCDADRCCTRYCDLDAPDTCSGDLTDTTCKAWMASDPKWDNVGVCVL